MKNNNIVTAVNSVSAASLRPITFCPMNVYAFSKLCQISTVKEDLECFSRIHFSDCPLLRVFWPKASATVAFTRSKGENLLDKPFAGRIAVAAKGILPNPNI